jgi:hypothetical protein
MLSILLAAALSNMWDDETFLGRGPTAGAGVSVAISRHFSVEGEAAWGSHHRDSGYLEVQGHALTTAGRLSFAFRNPDAAVRPFVSAGVTWTRSSDVFTTSSLAPGPTGQPVTGPSARAEYKTSLGGSEFGLGAEIKAGTRVKIRPEVRWSMTASDPSFKPGTLEPPLLGVRAGVTLVWTPRK